MASWLQRQRKAELVEMAEKAGIRGVVNSMRKDDLIVLLEQQLHQHASTLSKEPFFHDYFNRILSPVKRESEVIGSALDEDVASSVRARPRQRASRALQSETDFESSPGPSSNLLAHAQALAEAAQPATQALQDFTASLPLPMPPSPSQVADLVERRTSIAATNIRRYYTSHRIPQNVNSVREALSSVYSVETAFILLEAWGLQRRTLPWKYAFSLPASSFTDGNPLRIFIPDFFVLLAGSFWHPTLLWITTSFMMPAIFGWLFNFSIKSRRGGYDIDPLVFNIVKIGVTWLVYARGQRLGGLFSDTTVQSVNSSVPGGWFGMVVGAAISAIMTLYEAILNR